MKRKRAELCKFSSESNRNISDELDDCLFLDCMYGVQDDDIVEETDQFVAAKIQEMEHEIDQLAENVKDSFFIALREEIKQQTHYIRSEKFMLGFLRSESYDCSKAALRLAKFLNWKLHLFGPEMLPRRIRQADLDDDEKKILKSGFMHFCGVDCGGRLVGFFHRERLHQAGMLNEYYIKKIRRVCFYYGTHYMMSADGQSQRKGVIGIHWGLSGTMSLKNSKILLPNVKMCAEAMPFKIGALHHCCNGFVSRLFVSLFQSMAPQRFKDKINFHELSAARCLSELSKYGIDIDALPVTQDGEFKIDIHRRQVEHMLQSDNNELPAVFDNAEDEVQIKYPDRSQGEEVVSNYHNPKSLLAVKYPTTSDDAAESIIEKSLCQQPAAIDKKSAPKLKAEEHLPLKLMNLLEHNSFPDAIWWSRDGTAFAIHRVRFAEKVLPKEFRGIKFDSFIRRLKSWGFERLPKHQEDEAASSSSSSTTTNFTEYEHRLFQKDYPQLLNEWNNVAIKDKFPIRLMNILKSNKSSDAVWWINDGEAFAIDRVKFSRYVLDKHFEGIKFKSFCRMLKRWGFQRMTDLPEHKNSDSVRCAGGNATTLSVFQHDLFRKDVPLTSEQLQKWPYSKSGSSQSSGSKSENFPKKLYRILSVKQSQRAIWWVDGGRAFAIHIKNFCKDILPKEYNGIKFQSFQRSMKRWGFEPYQGFASSSTVPIFQHPSFKKDSPELLNKWS